MLHLKSTVAHSTRILSNQRTTNGNYIYYHNLKNPHNLEEKGEWPQKTNLWCRYCCHPFDTTPIPIPVSFDRKTKQYAIYGNYCSFACASAWLREHNFPDAACQRSLLSQMARDVFDYMDPIYAAPPSERLIVFGGDMSIEDFRLYSQTGKQCFVRTVPLIGSLRMLEEHVPPGQHQGEEEQTLKQKNHNEQEMTTKSIPVEQDIVVHEETITASGRVPPGGLFQAFIEQQQKQLLEKENAAQEEKKKCIDTDNSVMEDSQPHLSSMDPQPHLSSMDPQQPLSSIDPQEKKEDEDDVVMTDCSSSSTSESPVIKKTAGRKRKKPSSPQTTPSHRQQTASLLQFLQKHE